MSLERPGQGYPVQPRGEVYDLVSAAQSGADNETRLRAVAALGKSGDPRAVRPVADLLKDADPEIRQASVIALGLLRSGRPVDDLVARLRDPNEHAAIREQAAVALASIRSTGAVRGLREFIADGNEDSALRTRTENLLKDIGAEQGSAGT
ncbi:HEAT repeat domain-containing protein [Methanoregula sp.]|uniref:HEAT repeat domain-containing protein n=1 Tax=Methanoregula sp. TaxID=2052170 RepID=UPI00260AFACB|nr:HEAT repeat domain-containing protein [Methanoregula sp.]MDD5144329.1 HEAT repeat domain-containing protein [Methanoregula sp.]